MRLQSSSGYWREGSRDRACERAALLITRQIDGESTQDEAGELRAHVACCPACRRAMEIQTAQSRQLAQNLRSLWPASAAQKKNNRSLLKLFNFRHRLHTLAACIAFAAAITSLGFFASTARAPSDISREVSSKERISDPAAILPHIRPEPQPASAVVAKPDETRQPSPAPVDAAPERVTSPVIIETADSFPLDAFEFEPEAFVTHEKFDTTPILNTSPEFENNPVVSSTQTLVELANLGAIVPLKPLAGVSMKYAVTTPSGARDEGRVWALGDVLNGKGGVRFERSSGDVLEAAQADIDTVLPEALRAVARKLINACAAPQHRKQIQRAIETLRGRE